MPINWTHFENDLIQYMDAHSAQNEAEFGKYLVTLYDTQIKTYAVDILYGNGIITTNVSVFINAAQNAFKTAKSDRDGSIAPKVIESMLGAGLLAYWTGATLAPLIPPPTSISVVSNTVTVAGSPLKVVVNNTSDSKIFAKRLSAAFRTHLLTVQGLTIALVPQPTGAPIPIPFPFTGIN